MSLPEQLEQILGKALQREIPLLTDQELDDRRRKFYQLRSDFSSFCVTNQLFYTLALLTTCEIRMDHSLPALAALSANGKKMEVIFHPLAVDLWEKNRRAAFFLFCHELRHIVQAASLRAVEEMVDLEPIREVLVSKKKQASDKAAKDKWQESIDALDDRENQKWKMQRHRIANVTMDAALHQDLAALFPDTFGTLDAFLRDTYVPYTKGFSFETVAKDSVVAGSFEKTLAEYTKNFGPKKKRDFEAFCRSKSRTDEEVLAEAMRQGIGVQTVPGMIDLMNSTEKFVPSINENEKYEWLQLSDEYVRWMAANMDEELDPDNPPQDSGEGSLGEMLEQMMQGQDSLDQHGFGDEKLTKEQREEIERKVRDAIRRAENEGKIMAHRAGSAIGDSEMMGDSTETLNKKIHEALKKIKIKFYRIFSESKMRRYDFAKMNRAFSEITYLPGSRKEEKPRPQVVLVLDTSGSMWNKQYVNQMLSIARLLHREGKLCSMYFCDTRLHRVNFNASLKEQGVIGGGGTELSVAICEEIQKNESFKSGWELVYATDEFCPGLEEAKCDRRWKIHIINVPNLLG